MIGRQTSKRDFQRYGCSPLDDKEWKTKHKHAILSVEVPAVYFKNEK